jgi:hypothetical protein
MSALERKAHHTHTWSNVVGDFLPTNFTSWNGHHVAYLYQPTHQRDQRGRLEEESFKGSKQSNILCGQKQSTKSKVAPLEHEHGW